MKSTGIVRKVDELGRIVLPSELRNTLSIKEKDSLEIFIEERKIILRKYEPSCIFTGNMEELIEYKGKKVSREAIIELATLADVHI
ncbi:MAG: AbrB/MazE/SpoVT family DNA-binding domain-containing protein [Clostridiales bacterium]|jgi:transcriptional pleiotropic regulator of transition state genes|nr:AbrB/MazE/SpoVT family DNA-binding domain-containing protein [Clostridiales bacterium]